MKTVNKFHKLIYRVRNGDHYEFYDEIISFVQERIASLGDLLKLWTVFVTVFQKEDDIYKRSQKSAETGDINEANKDRLDQYRLIRGTVETAAFSKDPAVRQAAVKLSLVMNNFKAVSSASMTQASALIKNLIQDLRRPAYAPYVTTLALTAATDALEQYNDAFKALYKEREHSQGEAILEGNMAYIRPLTDKAFTDFTEALDGFYAVAKVSGNTAGMETFGAIIDHINFVIHNYSNIYARITGASSDGSKNKPGDGDDDDAGGGDTPSIPLFHVASQEVPESGEVMYVTATDAAAFAAALYPAATGGSLILKSAAEEAILPIAGFKMEADGDGNQTPAALEAAPPSANRYFLSPLLSEGPAEARIEKDGAVLARLSGMVFPNMYSFD
ncbi:MAG: DUF6261 family protein [Tannerellaceae bacterium]|nr:DUF6261 family protein [Tannerellaceae bacterium]